jgi:hypothetical protein
MLADLWLFQTTQNHNLEGHAFRAGVEPHGVLPIALPTIFNNLIDRLPPSIGSCYGVATSTVFRLPIMRQVWWWLDLRPASRTCFHELLDEGHSVAVAPGGVQECIYMGPGKEVVFLRKRLGFVRIALQHGCVPISAAALAIFLPAAVASTRNEMHHVFIS